MSPSEKDSFPIRLGTAESPATMDARKLLDTRLLITGNSGAGKSWLARLLAELVAQRVPIIVLDPEGEFVSLREKIDLVVVSSEGGDLSPSVRTAGLLARRLLELSQSAVIDLYSLKLPERRVFVRTFLDALMAAPREHWHPLFVVLDEAHKYAGEQGREHGRDASASTDAVITLLSQGRKRGICGVLLTQRLSKLHKDAAAECVNVLVGRTTLPNDVDRAADLLSMGKKDATFLRKLPVGHWCGYGPAFLSDDDVVRFKAAQVKTTHPESGRQHLRPPAPSSKIKKVLAELQDLDEKVETEENELEGLRARVAELETRPMEVDVASVDESYQKGYSDGLDVGQQEGRAAGFDEGWSTAEAKLATLCTNLIIDLSHLTRKVEELDIGLGSPNGKNEYNPTGGTANVLRLSQDGSGTPLHGITPRVPDYPVQISPPRHRAAASTNGIGRGAPWRLLAAMLQNPGQQSRDRVCALAGVAPHAGNTNNAWGALRSQGLIVDHPDKRVEASNEARRTYAGKVAPLPTGAALLDYWQGRLGRGAPGRIFTALTDEPTSREEICRLAGVEPGVGNTNNAFGKLRGLGIMDDHPGKRISLSANLTGA